MVKIKVETDRLNKENKGMVELTNFLVKVYPCKVELPILSNPVDKKSFMKYILAYSPDKQDACPAEWKHDLSAWKDFCTETMKVLNHYYEIEFKQ